jgi:biotin operon repressor
MSSEQFSLEDLLVDERELNEEMLAETLSDIIQIGKDSGGLYPRAAFADLNSYRKTAVILLAQHAREALALADTEWLSPSEIAEAAGMKKGTVFPAVRKLEEKGLAESDDGSYRIPAPNLSDVQRYIEEADDE